MAERPLTATERAKTLIAGALAGAGAPVPFDLAGRLLGVLDREGIRLVDEPIRPPIGTRRRRGQPQAAPASDGLGPPRGVRQRRTSCTRCRHPEHLGVCGVLPDDETEQRRCRCRA